MTIDSLLGVLLLLVGGYQTVAPVPSQPDISQQTQQQLISQERPGQGGQPGMRGGPYTHEVRSASSSDGLTWTHDSEKSIVEHASVPGAIIQPDGTIMMYFVDASDGPDKLGCMSSTDEGETFETEECIIEDLSVKQAVDYAIVQLPDTRYRLYYFGSNAGAGDPGEDPEAHQIYSAISDDGITFKEEGVVFEYEGLVDPDVFWNGETWVMHVHSITANGTVVATSDSGIEFTFKSLLEPQGYGVTKPVELSDGTFRMYGFKQGSGEQMSIHSFISDDGITWTQEEGTRLEAPEGYEITDPSVVQISDDSYKMLYKLSPKQEMNRPLQMPPQ